MKKIFLLMMLLICAFTKSESKELYAVSYFRDCPYLIFYYDDMKALRSEENGFQTCYSVNPNSTEVPQWVDSSPEIVAFDPSFADFHELKSTKYWFSHLENLKFVHGLTNVDFSNVTNMESMFEGCASLKTIDLSNLGYMSGNYVNMSNMFRDCKQLTTIYVGAGWQASFALNN